MKSCISMVMAVVMAMLLMASTPCYATPTTPFSSNTASIPVYSLYGEAATGYKVVQGDVNFALAKGQYNASMTDLGWDYLRVSHTKNSWENPSYYMGILEGYLTADRIEKMYVPTASKKAGEWVAEHIDFMTKMSTKLAKYDKMWQAVYMLLQQLEGLAVGYNLKNTNAKYTALDMFMINFGDEIGDVEQAVSVQTSQAELEKVQKQLDEKLKSGKAAFNSHCSALIKVTEDDMFVSHDTWDSFTGMVNRFFKVYDYPEETVTFSAHAAFIASGDDWYQTKNSQLAVQETTNGIMNASLYLATKPHSVSEFIRAMGATMTAKNGEDWTTSFSRYNSGTYNNQYMVADFKVFAPGAEVAPGLLWIAEQIPGFMGREDVTEHLKNHGHWASYNIPYFYYIYQVSGYEKLYKEQGNFWSYKDYARGEIFARNQSGITKIEDMQRMMRYNNYKVDPLSIIQNCTAATGGKCDPDHSSMLSIASRGDLMEVYNSTAEMIAHYGVVASFVAQGCFGAIDSKIARWSDRYTMTPRVISGPTNDQVPTFQWGASSICPNIPDSKLCPAKVDFPWVDFKNISAQIYSM